MKQALLFHPGTQYGFRLASQLHRHGALSAFYTGMGFSSQRWTESLTKISPPSWHRFFENRLAVGLPSRKLHCLPLGEIMAYLRLQLGAEQEEVFFARNAAFQRAIPDAEIRAADMVIGFDTSSWIVAERARNFGRPFVLDRSIGHARSFERVATRLRSDFADWSSEIPEKSPEGFVREETEYELSSQIVVPSHFAADTLIENGVEAQKIRVNPFGTDLERFHPAKTIPNFVPFRFLFAGSLQPRKGLPLLLDAWNSLPTEGRAELWIVGGGRLPSNVRAELKGTVRFLGRVSPSRFADISRDCHVLVFPSYFEGLAQVQIEAAACGLPVIGTRNSGCEEIITHEKTGYVLPVGDSHGLRAAMAQLIKSPEAIIPMRQQLLEERDKWGWDAYGDRWAQLIGDRTGDSFPGNDRADKQPGTADSVSRPAIKPVRPAQRASDVSADGLKVLLAHPGTQHAFRLALELRERRVLKEFWTCFAVRNRFLFPSAFGLLPSIIQEKLTNRAVLNLRQRELRTMPFLEFRALRQLSRGGDPQIVMRQRNQRFQEAIPGKSISDADVLIGFDTSSWVLVERAARAGKTFLLDQTTAHPQSAQASALHACRDFPQWSETVPVVVPSLLEEQRHEHNGADLIVTASSFARGTLIANGVAADKVRVNPYGVDLNRFRPRESAAASRKFRFAFVGSISAKKGVALLLAAWQQLRDKEAELWVVGDVARVKRLIPALPGLKLLGRRSRAELPALLRSCDVFVFPSYSDGFGLVLLEAMASGLPVITTTATGGPDIVTPDSDGWLIAPGDLEELVHAMRFCLENRDRVAQMGATARVAAERFSWHAYGDRWLTILQDLVPGI